jgi:hypothetical protein
MSIKIPLTIEAYSMLSLSLPEYKKGKDVYLRNKNNEYSLCGVLCDLYSIKYDHPWVQKTKSRPYEMDEHTLGFPTAVAKWALMDADDGVKLKKWSDSWNLKHKEWPSQSTLKKVFWFDDTDAKRREKNRK